MERFSAQAPNGVHAISQCTKLNEAVPKDDHMNALPTLRGVRRQEEQESDLVDQIWDKETAYWMDICKIDHG